MMITVFHGEPGFWSGRSGTRPNQAPVYGQAMNSRGEPMELDQEVLVHHGMGLTPTRGLVVSVGDFGLPDMNVVKVRQHGAASLFTAASERCEPHVFDEYDWLSAETKAAAVMTKRDVDLARCFFGGFYFEEYQRLAMRFYLESRAATPTQEQ